MLDANDDITWTLLDSVTKIARIEITDGRQSIFDVTEAATCRILIHDRTGDFDPNNPSAAYYGIEGKPLAVALFNPVSAVWVPQFRGNVEDINFVIEPTLGQDGKPILAKIQIEAVGVFAYLARAGMQIGVSGDTSPSPGIVFYEDGPIANPGGPGGRLEHLAADAGISTDMYVFFSGNVNLLESKYDAGDKFLGAFREAVEAEFPGLANLFEDKLGRLTEHGRLARLTPDAVAAEAGAAWDFNRWNAGDGTAIAGDSSMAQIRALSYGRPLDMVVNSATCYPYDILDADIFPDQFVKDDASITALGIRSWDKPGLILKEHKTNGDTGAEQTAKMADFMVSYFAVPMTWIDTITFKSVHPDDPRAASTWGLITGGSIADIVNVNVGYPGSTGVQDSDNFIEGRSMVITPLQPGFDFVELSLNLSPYVEDTLAIFV